MNSGKEIINKSDGNQAKSGKEGRVRLMFLRKGEEMGENFEEGLSKREKMGENF